MFGFFKNSTKVPPIDVAAEAKEEKGVLLYALVALGLALFIRFFVATPYLVSGSSMDDTFHNNNYLIVDRLSYRLTDPKRGDVIVFTLPTTMERDLIKRVIGLPGETVRIQNNAVTIFNTVHPQGVVLNEPYLTPAYIGGPDNIQVTIPANEYFVLGDHRNVSLDSRSWGFLPRTEIVGRVFLRLFPFTQINVLPGEARYPELSAQ